MPEEYSPRADLLEARVIDVDADKHIYRVQFIRGEEPADSVASFATYAGNRGGGWMGGVPEVGDYCLVASPTYGETYSILAYKTLPRGETLNKQLEDGEYSNSSKRDDYSAGRLPVKPGDMGIWSASKAYVAVRRSGDVEIVGSPVTATRWFPTEQAIRSICGTMETLGFFGTSSWYTHRDEAREAAGETPTGYSAWVKTHAEAAPNVNVELGAVLGEEKTKLPGRKLRHTRRPGGVCLRLEIFDQEFADRYAALAQMPDGAGARLSLKADEEGNVQWLQTGTYTRSMGNRVEHVAGRERKQVDGDSYTFGEGNYTVERGGFVQLHGSRGAGISTGGDFVLECDRFIVRAGNDEIKTDRGYSIHAGERLSLKGDGPFDMGAGGDASMTFARALAQSVGGAWVTNVLGSADQANLGKDVEQWGVKVHRGAAHLRSVQGSFELSIGPDANPVARLRMFQDPRNPGQIGRIHLGFPLTNSGLTLSPDGAWELTGPTGGIKADAAGRIQIGKDVNAVGNVITTLSHPHCFVTGIPTRGHSDVVVSAGPLLPLTGVPSTGVTPPTRNTPKPKPTA